MKRFILCMLLMLAVMSGGCGSDSPGGKSDETQNDSEKASGQNYKPGDILVVFRPPEFSQAVTASAVKDGVYASYMASIADVEGCTVTETFSALSQHGNGLFAVLHTEEGTEEETVKRLKARPDIIGAGLNYKFHAAARITPNEKMYASHWGMEAIKAPEAWGVSTGSGDIYVAVMDSGIDYTHLDIAQNFETDGYSVNCLTPNLDGSYSDEDGHGTHVAGTIGAVGNNGIGVAGLNWNVKLISLRVLDKDGNGSAEAIIRALSYLLGLLSADQNMKMPAVNMSLQADATEKPETLLNHPYYLALKQLDDTNRTVMCMAAGNFGKELGNGSYSYPASFTGLNNKIVVAAADNTENYSRCEDFSNWSKYYVDIAAPGRDIISTLPQQSTLEEEFPTKVVSEGEYKYLVADGTSMAAPHVTGAVALLASVYPNATASELKTGILYGANSDYATDYTRWGFLDVEMALDVMDALYSPLPFPVSPDPKPPVKPIFPVRIDEEHFPDETFRSCVSKYDSDNDGILSRNEAENVTEISLRYKYIASLKGIEYFISLQTLDCSNNKLTSLDVSKNTALDKLDCSNNKLTVLDVSKNLLLTKLLCSNNQIAVLDVSRNRALVRLNCYSNKLTALDVSKNIFLTELLCNNNQIAALDVSRNKDLIRIYCYSNKLTSLDVSNHTALITLKCGTNQLTEVNATNCKSLTMLDCFFNLYIKPPLNLQVPTLRTLNLEGCTALTDLKCGWNNYLTYIDLSDCTELTNLECGNYYMSVLDLSKCTKLTTLSCNATRIAELDLSHCPALTNLECYNGSLVSLDISKCTALKRLECFGNQLKTLDVSNCTSLTNLKCLNNNLKALDVRNCTMLTSLECWKNNLTELDVSRNSRLRLLYCYNNRLTQLDVSNCADNIEVKCDSGVNVIRKTPPQIVMCSLSNAVKNKAYSFQFDAESKLPVTWSLESGSFPEGLILSESGLISGTPIKAGTYTFKVTASNSVGSTSAGFTLQVFTPVTISTSSLKAGTFGKSYSVTLKAKGTTPVTWSASGLPAGLSINKTSGKISGKPSATGTFSVKIKAKNAASSKTKTLKLKINAVKPKLSGTLDDAELGIAYTSQLNLTAGSPVITWSASGLPEGLSIDPSTGIISGTPSDYSASGFNVTITAANSAGSDSLNVKLTVKGTAPKITTSKLTNATQGKSYKLTVKASGSRTITWKAKNLPSGLSINKKTGKISGTPKVSGSFKVTLYASNPVKTVSKKLTLKVKAAEAESTLANEEAIEEVYSPNEIYIRSYEVQTGIAGYSQQNEKECFIAASLGEISADNDGMYDFALTLSDDIHAGLELIYLANSDKPSDDDNIAEFFDDEGSEISAVPENRKIIISIWLNKGVIYSPAVYVKK